MASSSSSSLIAKKFGKIRVTCYWDFQNAWIPGYNLRNLRSKIQKSLEYVDNRFVVEEEDLIAVGPKNAIAEQIRQAGIRVIPLANIAIQCDVARCTRYVHNNQDATQVKLRRKTDAADFELVKMMHFNAIGDGKNVKHILLIAGDGDYNYCMQCLSQESDVFLMLAESDPPNQDLHTFAKHTWRWIKMIEGCPPLKKPNRR